MIIKYKYHILAISFVLMSSCSTFNIKINRMPKIEGYWLSIDDPNNYLIITKDSILQYYNNKQIDASDYKLSKKSCDSRTTGNRFYLSETNFKYSACYEISADDKNLTFIDLSNPSKRYTYNKINY